MSAGDEPWIREYAERVKRRLQARLEVGFPIGARADEKLYAEIAELVRGEFLSFARATTVPDASDLSVRVRHDGERFVIECATNDPDVRAVLVAGGFMPGEAAAEQAPEDTFARALADVASSDPEAYLIMRAFAQLGREDRALFLAQAHAAMTRMRGASREVWMPCVALLALFSKWVDVLRDADAEMAAEQAAGKASEGNERIDG